MSDVFEQEKRDLLDRVRNKDVKLCGFFSWMFGKDGQPPSEAL